MDEPEKVIDMRVAAKVIQSLASGIYRTPANAIKELVSNSFDADAPYARIEISRSKNNAVSQIAVEDEGEGLSIGDFEYSMLHIGGSIKRFEGAKTRLYTKKERPIIGKIGVGLLAVGHATSKFTLISVRKDDPEGFMGRIDLAPYYDNVTALSGLEELKIGSVKIYKFDKNQQNEKYRKKLQYTRILLDEVRPPFSRELAFDGGENFEFPNVEEFNPSAESNPDLFSQFVEWMDRKQIRKRDFMSGYCRFLWELGLLAPVRYLPAGPVRGYEDSPVIGSLRKRLESYDFRVYVDGIEVFKPIVFPQRSDLALGFQRGIDYKVYEVDIEKKLGVENKPGARRLSAKGYYYHQTKRIIPFDLRGFLIRVNDVGIGDFDNRFAKIFNESPVIQQQLTGELYVDSGLDEALNIDRNSFFESDIAYQTLYMEILKRLNAEQLPDEVKKKYSADQFERLQQKAIVRDIRRRNKRREDQKKVVKESKEHTRLAANIRSAMATFGYPRPNPHDITIEYNRNEAPTAVVSISAKSSRVQVVLAKRYPKPVENTLARALTALALAVRESKGSAKLVEKNFVRALKTLLE